MFSLENSSKENTIFDQSILKIPNLYITPYHNVNVAVTEGDFLVTKGNLIKKATVMQGGAQLEIECVKFSIHISDILYSESEICHDYINEVVKIDYQDMLNGFNSFGFSIPEKSISVYMTEFNIFYDHDKFIHTINYWMGGIAPIQKGK